MLESFSPDLVNSDISLNAIVEEDLEKISMNNAPEFQSIHTSFKLPVGFGQVPNLPFPVALQPFDSFI